LKFFSVKNWSDFQHYSDRSPPWIKLHNALLDNYRFGRLPDAGKAHLISIWLLASLHDNCLPWDAEWIRAKIQAHDAVDLKELNRQGFIEVLYSADASQAECSKVAQKGDEQ
jgi:hypothetical protein